MLPPTAVPLAALALLAVAAALVLWLAARRGARPRPSTIAWLVVPAAALAWLASWCEQGLFEGGRDALAAFSGAALLAGAAALARGPLLSALDALGERHRARAELMRAALAVVALAAGTALGFLALELPYNETYDQVAPGFAAIECSLVAGGLLLLYLLFQRRGAGIALGVGALAATGVAQHFVAAFKAAAILPNDLFALGTAAAVSGNYVYSVDDGVLLGLSCWLAAVALSALVAPSRAATRRGRAANVAGNLAAAAVAAAALVAGVTVPSYFDDLGVGMEYWYSLDYYERQGFLTTFVAVAQDLPIDVPEGYSADGAAATEAAYAARYDEGAGSSAARVAAEAQFAEVRPAVVCVMNETFADLSCLDGERWGYAGIPYYGSLSDTLMGGDLAVSVLGGGTCNSEFEFLTGVSLAFVGDGKYPYSLYDLSSAPSLARQFSELGYRTTAIHPNYATNWNRDRVYRQMGFDDFLTIDDFEGAEYYHSGVSDAATYDKVLELLRSDDAPQLIFDVTMQNHSSYDKNNIGEVTQYAVDGVSDYDNGRLSEYLGCIAESDRALEEFMAALSELDRPVVLVFFGDHQPALSSIVNDALWPDEAASGEAGALEHGLRTHETTYFVWANYDVAGSDQAAADVPSSPAYLGALLCEAVGVPLTDFQKTQLVAREELPAVSLLGALGPDGTWVALDDAAARGQAFRDLACVSYLEFASRIE